MTSKKEITNPSLSSSEQTVLLNTEMFILEQRKVKALEKIANSVDALTIWFEEIDKEEWSARIQYYLAEFYTAIKPEEVKPKEDKK
jgi:hypothetical protein